MEGWIIGHCSISMASWSVTFWHKVKTLRMGRNTLLEHIVFITLSFHHFDDFDSSLSSVVIVGSALDAVKTKTPIYPSIRQSESPRWVFVERLITGYQKLNFVVGRRI